MSNVVMYRRDLHKIPELGFNEFETQKYILNRLMSLNCDVTTANTNTFAYFNMHAKKTVAIRADIDGLKIEEYSLKDYRSTNAGLMHACGHDGHAAMVLALADYLSDNNTSVNVLLIFQSAEELILGANQVIDSEVLKKYEVQSVFGMHLWPGLDKGKLYTREHEFMAMATEINILIKGKAVHIANHNQGIDALLIGAQMLLEIYDYERTIASRHLLKFGKMEAGTIRNVIAKDALIQGSFRCYDREVNSDFKEELKNIRIRYEENYNCTIEITYSDSSNPVLNTLDIINNFGYELLKEPVLQGEDFGNYSNILPCAFFFLGIGNVPALHTDHFDFDDGILEEGLKEYIKLLNSIR